MLFSVSTYSFEQKRKAGIISQLDCVKKAKELGFDGIEFVDILPHDGSDRTSYAKRLRAACEEEGLVITSYTIAADLLNGCDGDMDAEIERVCGEVDMAALLGATQMRHDATWGSDRSFEEVLPRLIEGCRRITEYAETKGVRTMVENHGYYCQESARVKALVDGVGHANFGHLVDMGNFICVDEDSADAVSVSAPNAFYAHAKDFVLVDEADKTDDCFQTRGGRWIRGTVVGRGVIPVRECMDRLKQSGYQGNLALEFEGPEDAYEALAEGLAFLRSLDAANRR